MLARLTGWMISITRVNIIVYNAGHVRDRWRAPLPACQSNLLPCGTAGRLLKTDTVLQKIESNGFLSVVHMDNAQCYLEQNLAKNGNVQKNTSGRHSAYSGRDTPITRKT